MLPRVNYARMARFRRLGLVIALLALLERTGLVKSAPAPPALLVNSRLEGLPRAQTARHA